MVTTTGLDARTPRLSLAEKLWSLNWGLLLLLTTIASFGFAILRCRPCRFAFQLAHL